MTTMLGFMLNTISHEEFVAPIEAETREEAEFLLAAQYPTGPYKILTIYGQKEMQSILTSLERWPGLPSKVQPKLDDLLTRVRARTGSLPPLKPTPPAKPVLDGARIEQVRDFARGMDKDTQALAARLLAAEAGLATPAPTPMPTPRPATFTTQATTPATAPAMAPRAPAASGGSLIGALKAMRGDAPAATASATPRPTARPSAPATARGLAAPATPSPRMPAAGSPSLISVLKAMKSAG